MDKYKAKDIAILGAQYLANNIRPSGRFNYIRDLHGKRVKGQYNMLRHLGAIWAIHNLHTEVIDISKIFLAEEYANKTALHTPSTSFINCHKSAKLGANALAILALSGNTSKYQEGLDYFINMRTGKVDLHKFSLEDGFTPSTFVSEYYPGEAALSLCTTQQWEKALRLIHHTRDNRDKEVQLQDHWMAQALYLLHKAFVNDPVIAGFAKNYIARIASDILIHRDYLGRACPMACRVEGLIPAYKVTKDAKILEHIKYLLKKIAAYQQDNEKHKAYGAFRDTQGYRIDYTQHAVSAFYEYYKMM